MAVKTTMYMAPPREGKPVFLAIRNGVVYDFSHQTSVPGVVEVEVFDDFELDTYYRQHEHSVKMTFGEDTVVFYGIIPYNDPLVRQLEALWVTKGQKTLSWGDMVKAGDYTLEAAKVYLWVMTHHNKAYVV